MFFNINPIAQKYNYFDGYMTCMLQIKLKRGERGKFRGWSLEVGVLECWSVGVMECWSDGVME